MRGHKSPRTVAIALAFVTLAALNQAAFCDSVKVEGLIKARSGDSMTLQTSSESELVVLLTDTTQVGQVQGVFKARRKNMSMAALIPGLQVKVEGNYNEDRKLVATKVAFKGNDLEQAESIQAGLHETKVQNQQQQAELEKQNEALKAHNEELQKQQAQLTEQQQKIAANKAAIDAAIARFGQLDDYYIFDEVTVYFANGKTKVDPKYNSQLTALAQKATKIEGYLVQVEGYASSVGSASLNQKLSQDRAANVTNILIQQGRVPLTRMLSPGAMGESNQVGNDKTAEGQAENRRVVVQVLQNKGVAGHVSGE
jgi:outer membrane protein OmpA-like peptidoglycan-associated protein